MASPRALLPPAGDPSALSYLASEAAEAAFSAPPVSSPRAAAPPSSCRCFGSGSGERSRAEQLAADAALLRAAAVGHVSTLTAALAAGANLSTCDKLGDTAMHEAARHGHASCLEVLLDAGAPASQSNQRGYTPLHYAAHQGFNPCVYALLDAGADVAARVNASGWTPLHTAVSRGKAAAAAAIVRLGGDPLARAGDGATPYALANGDQDMEAALTPPARVAFCALVFSVPPPPPLRAASGAEGDRAAAKLAHDAALRRSSTAVANALRGLQSATVALLQQPTAQQLAEALAALAPPQLTLAELAAQQAAGKQAAG